MQDNGIRSRGAVCRSMARRRVSSATRPRLCGVAVLVAAVAAGLGGCGGTGSPGVANVTTTSTANGAGAATTAPKNDAAQSLVEWASCMRSHGDPNQADPVVTANKLIDIDWNPAIPGGYNGTNKGGQGNSGPGQYCRSYLQDAVVALQGGRAGEHPSSAELLKYSECMRTNGFPGFPDPSANGSLSLSVGSAMSPSNPVFRSASKLCAQKTGVQAFGSGTPPPGTIELNGAGP